MNDIIRFILEHYDVILSAVFSLVAFFISLRSYLKTKQSSGLAQVLAEIPTLCSQIECIFPNGCGAVKLDFVLKQIAKLCDTLSVPFDKSFFSAQVEKVLAAPSTNKKGGKYET